MCDTGVTSGAVIYWFAEEEKPRKDVLGDTAGRNESHLIPFLPISLTRRITAGYDAMKVVYLYAHVDNAARAQ